jgi:hypothetical protein
MKTPTLVPTNIFSIGDNITVVGNSKHRGRVATVQKVGPRRLTVQFHDKNKGTYVDYNDACIIDNTTPKTEEVMGNHYGTIGNHRCHRNKDRQAKSTSNITT